MEKQFALSFSSTSTGRSGRRKEEKLLAFISSSTGQFRSLHTNWKWKENKTKLNCIIMIKFGRKWRGCLKLGRREACAITVELWGFRFRIVRRRWSWNSDHNQKTTGNRSIPKYHHLKGRLCSRSQKFYWKLIPSDFHLNMVKHVPEELKRNFTSSDGSLKIIHKSNQNRFSFKASEDDSDSVGTPVLLPSH